MLDQSSPTTWLTGAVIGVSFRMAFARRADGRPGLALVELSVVEQRYRAVLEAAAGVPVTEVAARYEVSRQSVHAWIVRYREGGLGALADRPRRPDTCPHQVSAQVEAAVCELRREHSKWGPLRLVHELARAGVTPVPSRMSAYRVLVRHGLVEPGPRRRRKDGYLRWERDEPMALWQIDIVGGAFLADGSEAKIVTRDVSGCPTPWVAIITSFSEEHDRTPDPYDIRDHAVRTADQAERRVFARLSKAQDPVGCVMVLGYSPPEGRPRPYFYTLPPTSRTHYSAAGSAMRSD